MKYWEHLAQAFTLSGRRGVWVEPECPELKGSLERFAPRLLGFQQVGLLSLFSGERRVDVARMIESLHASFPVFIFYFYFLNFLFYIGVQPVNNVMIVSGGEQRDPAIRIHVCILPQTLHFEGYLYCWIETRIRNRESGRPNRRLLQDCRQR